MAPSYQTTKAQLLRILLDLQSTQPNTPVSLSKIARTLGKPRQWVHLLYHQLAVDYELPPVAKRGFGQLDHETKHAIRAMGGEAAQARGVGHFFTSGKARMAVKSRYEKSEQARKERAEALTQKVKALREEGMHSGQIQSELGISSYDLRRIIAQLIRTGETPHKLTYQKTLAFEAEVRAYKEQGMTGTEIARKTGKGATYIYHVLYRLNIPPSKLQGKQLGTVLPADKPNRQHMRVAQTSQSPSSLSTRKRLLQLLQDHSTTQPDTPVSLDNLVQTLDVSKDRVLQLYRQLAVKFVLPPLKKAALPVESSHPSPQLTKAYLLKILQYLQSAQPNTPVSLSKIARTLGKPRQWVHLLYHQLADDYVLPPVAKAGFGQLDPETKHTIALMGWKAVHAKGTAHRLTKEETKRAQQNSLQKRAQRPKTLALEAQVRAYRAAGMGTTEIARRTGRPIQTIHTVIQRLAQRGENVSFKETKR